MALINCPECKNEVSSYAKNCPNCGYRIKKFGCVKWFGIFIIVIIIFFFKHVYNVLSDSSDFFKDEDIKSIAYEKSQDFVKEELVYPSMTDFPDFSFIKDFITNKGEGKYEIYSWVKFLNEDVVEIKKNYRCSLAIDEYGNWILEDIYLFE